MQKVHNFCAGPCILPQEVYLKSAAAIVDYKGSGVSLLSMSHRSEDFLEILAQARALALSLLSLDSGEWEVLFLQGGASMEFTRVAMNFLHKKAGYINSGVWATKAYQQAQIIGNAVQVGSSEHTGFRNLPRLEKIDTTLDYLHYTSNNTIYGTQYQEVIQAEVPVVCDMSSDIYSKQVDVSSLDLIYAGAQKNIGPAGVSVVFVKKSFLANAKVNIPSILSYPCHVEADGLYHTANVFAIYTCLLNLQWLEKQGGVSNIERVNETKASLLYKQIDAHEFMQGYAQKECRSKMNVTFDFVDKEISKRFDALCLQANIVNIKGHRALGGYRASLYNALPLHSVEVLVEVLQQLKAEV